MNFASDKKFEPANMGQMGFEMNATLERGCKIRKPSPHSSMEILYVASVDYRYLQLHTQNVHEVLWWPVSG